jgi:hypothetical protein
LSANQLRKKLYEKKAEPQTQKEGYMAIIRIFDGGVSAQYMSL